VETKNKTGAAALALARGLSSRTKGGLGEGGGGCKFFLTRDDLSKALDSLKAQTATAIGTFVHATVVCF